MNVLASGDIYCGLLNRFSQHIICHTQSPSNPPRFYLTVCVRVCVCVSLYPTYHLLIAPSSLCMYLGDRVYQDGSRSHQSLFKLPIDEFLFFYLKSRSRYWLNIVIAVEQWHYLCLDWFSIIGLTKKRPFNMQLWLQRGDSRENEGLICVSLVDENAFFILHPNINPNCGYSFVWRNTQAMYCCV